MLGERLAAELGPDDSRDTLARWMAHYIAELMQSAERADPDGQTPKRKECADAILALWQHRQSLPLYKRPFGDFEDIFRALAKLDPQATTFNYLSLIRELDEERRSNAPDWLRLADTVDRVARRIVKLCVEEAAIEAGNRSPEYAALAQSAWPSRRRHHDCIKNNVRL